MYNKHIIIIISVGIHQIYSVHYLNKFILDDLRHSIINNEEKSHDSNDIRITQEENNYGKLIKDASYGEHGDALVSIQRSILQKLVSNGVQEE